MDDGSSNTNETKNDPVTISAPPNATVTIDPQNPLPEASFMWRRIITLGVVATLLALDWYLADKIHDLKSSRDLLTFAKWNIAVMAAVLTYYFIAPSAAELTNIVQSASIIRHSLTTAAETALAAPQPPQSEPKSSAASPDSQISEAAPGEAYRPPSDDLTDLAQDAAPTSRK